MAVIECGGAYVPTVLIVYSGRRYSMGVVVAYGDKAMRLECVLARSAILDWGEVRYQ